MSSIWYIVAVIACVIHLIHSCSLLMYIYKCLEVLFSISIISPLHSQMCCNSWQPLKLLHAWWWPAFQWGWHGQCVSGVIFPIISPLHKQICCNSWHYIKMAMTDGGVNFPMRMALEKCVWWHISNHISIINVMYRLAATNVQMSNALWIDVICKLDIINYYYWT